MGFFERLFGFRNSKPKLSIQDNYLGVFSALSNSKTRILWNGTTDFLGNKVSLNIYGDDSKLDYSQKELVISILENQTQINQEIDKSLKEQYDNADKEYITWRDHFKVVSIASSEYDIYVIMEEIDSMYLFNILFKDNKAIDVTVDS